MDALEELRKQHVEAKSMLAELEQASEDQRGGKWAKLRPILAAHEQVEEQFVYDPAVKEATARAPRISEYHQMHEQQVNELKQMLDRIGDQDARSPQFLSMLTQLQQTLEQHVAFEQDQFWPLLRDAWGMERLQEAGDQVHSASEAAKAGAGISGMMGGIGDALGHMGGDR
jgi:iron-sulfur cluster repair protein YtfE (RIC family)